MREKGNEKEIRRPKGSEYTPNEPLDVDSGSPLSLPFLPKK